jgi:glycerophosphoryl diester phosphodiesterase
MKHPTHFARIGLAMSDALRQFLEAKQLNRRGAPVIVQCFEEQALRSLRVQGVRTRLVFLVSADGGPYDQTVAGRPRTYADYIASGLAEVREFADGLGVDKAIIALTNGVAAAQDVIARAHEARLFVHAWTFRPENHFLPADLRRGDPARSDFARLHGDLAAEVRRFAEADVDGIITDFPAYAIEALTQT